MQVSTAAMPRMLPHSFQGPISHFSVGRWSEEDGVGLEGGEPEDEGAGEGEFDEPPDHTVTEVAVEPSSSSYGPVVRLPPVSWREGSVSSAGGAGSGAASPLWGQGFDAGAVPAAGQGPWSALPNLSMMRASMVQPAHLRSSHGRASPKAGSAREGHSSPTAGSPGAARARSTGGGGAPNRHLAPAVPLTALRRVHQQAHSAGGGGGAKGGAAARHGTKLGAMGFLDAPVPDSLIQVVRSTLDF